MAQAQAAFAELDEDDRGWCQASLDKLATAAVKIVTLERQAHNLDDDKPIEDNSYEAALRRLSRSTLGAALQAVRDAPERAAASGLNARAIKYRIFMESATLAGLAGGLFAAHQGTVFPSVASVATSVDALLVVLLGGLHQVWGTVAGAAILVGAAAELGRSSRRAGPTSLYPCRSGQPPRPPG